MRYLLLNSSILALILQDKVSGWTPLSSSSPRTRTISMMPQEEPTAIAPAVSKPVANRRHVLSFTAAVALLGDSAHAFSNKISNQYDDRPKRRGPQPKDLGVGHRKTDLGDEYVGLKRCGVNGAPNCFCSTEDPEDDPDHILPAWAWPPEMDKRQAFEQLEKVIQAYEPGQSGIDGGGFQIVTIDTKLGYLYAQFQSLKNGYIDDFEVARIDGRGTDRTVQVRSSSRVGYLDYGVNAKRVNYIAKKLREQGWDAVGVDLGTHRNYAIQNELV